MKKLLSTLLVVLIGFAATAQTKKGIYAAGSIGADNLGRDQRLIMTVSPELIAMGGVLGIGVVHNSTLNLYKDSKVKYHNPKGKSSSVGVKLYGKVATVDAISFFLTAEGDYIIEPLDKKIASDYIWKPGAALMIPLNNKFDAGFSYVHTFLRQGYKGKPVWKQYEGGNFRISMRL